MALNLGLNLRVAGNYVFCDPAANIHLSLEQPRGRASRLTPSVLRGLRAKTLVDIDGVVDIKEGKLKEAIPVAAAVEAPVSDVQETTLAVAAEQVKEAPVVKTVRKSNK